MSVVKIQGNASGTGIFTIAAPNSNTDRTLTLPDVTGTVVTQNASGLITASGGITLGDYQNIGATTNATGISLTGGSATNNGGQINLRGGSFSGNSNGIEFIGGGSERARIDSSGNLLVGRTNNPGGLSSSLYVTGAYSNTTPSGANVFVNTDGSFYRSTSSLKYKTDVRDYARGLSDVAKLRPVFYKAKAGLNTEQEFAGFVAEEIEAAGLTEFVQYAEDGSPDALSYGNMVALAFKAIQELKAEVDALKAQLGAQA